MTRFVSFNGPDSSGKSTQVRMIAEGWEGFCDLGPIHRHDPGPWNRVSEQDYATWWFTTSTTEELTTMLFASHTKRAKALPPGKVGLIDRGWHMLFATAIATCAVKDSVPIKDAWHHVRALVGADGPIPCETSLLLLPSLDTERSLAIARSRDPRPWSGTYLNYQRHLHYTLLHMAHRNTFAEVIPGDHLDVKATFVHIRRTLLSRGIGAP